MTGRLISVRGTTPLPFALVPRRWRERRQNRDPRQRRMSWSDFEGRRGNLNGRSCRFLLCPANGNDEVTQRLGQEHIDRLGSIGLAPMRFYAELHTHIRVQEQSASLPIVAFLRPCLRALADLRSRGYLTHRSMLQGGDWPLRRYESLPVLQHGPALSISAARVGDITSARSAPLRRTAPVEPANPCRSGELRAGDRFGRLYAPLAPSRPMPPDPSSRRPARARQAGNADHTVIGDGPFRQES